MNTKQIKLSGFISKATLAAILMGAGTMSVASDMKHSLPSDKPVEGEVQLQSFNQLDRDGDGTLSWQEVDAAYADSFEQMGFDKQAVIDRFDNNGDKVFQQNEYAALSRDLVRSSVQGQASQAMPKATDGKTVGNNATARHDAQRRYDSTTDESAQSLAQVPANQAERLEGREVVNRQGKVVGEVEKVITQSGKVQDVVVSVGGFMGIGDKDVLVDARQLQTKGNRILWDTPLDENRLDNMQEYKESDEYS